MPGIPDQRRCIVICRYVGSREIVTPLFRPLWNLTLCSQVSFISRTYVACVESSSAGNSICHMPV